MKPPRLITTPLIHISPETWAEVRAVRERQRLHEQRQKWADAANDQQTEARTREPKRKNFHDL
jgi:hypothetical protein